MPLNRTEVDHLKTLPMRRHERNRVRLARTLTHTTQEQLAEALEMGQSRISQIERGEYETVPKDTAERIARLFHVPLDVLFPNHETVTTVALALPKTKRKAAA